MTILLLSLFFCHLLADYTHLSTGWMLQAKRFGKPLLPILVHAGVHALLMGIALTALGYGNPFQWDIVAQLMIFQLVTHFAIDVWKGRMNGWFPILQSPDNKWYWIIFGVDQYFHAVVIVLMAGAAQDKGF